MNLKRAVIVTVCVIAVIIVMLGLNGLATGADWLAVSQEVAIVAGLICVIAFVIGGITD